MSFIRRPRLPSLAVVAAGFSLRGVPAAVQNVPQAKACGYSSAGVRNRPYAFTLRSLPGYSSTRSPAVPPVLLTALTPRKQGMTNPALV